MKAFREAVETRDLHAMEALLADDVVFSSPVVYAPYHGKAITMAILANVIEVFENFRYDREIGAEGAADTALVFLADVDGRTLTGCDFIHVNEHGLIDEFMVMVRPLSGANALAAAMTARFDQITEQAAGHISAPM